MALPVSSIYRVLHLPVRYTEEPYEQTTLIQSKIQDIQKKIYNAPSSGTLLISGTAGPIVNQLYEMGRKCYGISFVNFYNDKLSNEDTMLPGKVAVAVIYGVGNEPAKNSEYGSKLLGSILDYYKNKEVLVIVETPLTTSDFLVKYGIEFSNKLNIRLKKEEAWV